MSFFRFTYRFFFLLSGYTYRLVNDREMFIRCLKKDCINIHKYGAHIFHTSYLSYLINRCHTGTELQNSVDENKLR